MRANKGGVSRFDYDNTALGQSFVKSIQDAGKGVSDAFMGYNKLRAEIGKRKAEALADIEDYDFQLLGAESGFANEATALENRINGIGDDAYDFRKITDVKRFEEDVEKFNQRLVDAGAIDKKLVEKRDDLEAQREIYLNSQKRIDDLPMQSIEGSGDLYDGHVLDSAYDNTMDQFAILGDNKLQTLDDGTLGLVDENGTAVKNAQGENITFDSIEDYLQAIDDVIKPDLIPAPADTGQEIVQNRGWGQLYKEEGKAESAFLQFVLDNPELAARVKLEAAGNPGGDYIAVESEYPVLANHPNAANGRTTMTDAQHELLESMMQEWRDEQARIKAASGKSGGGGRGSARDVLSLTPQIEMGITTGATDESGRELYVLNPDGSVQAAASATNNDSAVIKLDDTLTVDISLGYDDGVTRPFRRVEVSKLGYDGTSPFGIATFEIDGELQSVRIPLPDLPGMPTVGDLYGTFMQQYDMTPEQYSRMVEKLEDAYDRHRTAQQ